MVSTGPKPELLRRSSAKDDRGFQSPAILCDHSRWGCQLRFHASSKPSRRLASLELVRYYDRGVGLRFDRALQCSSVEAVRQRRDASRTSLADPAPRLATAFRIRLQTR